MAYRCPSVLPPRSWVTTPPDGMCLYHSLMAAHNVKAWQRIPRDKHGFINDPRAEATMRLKACALRSALITAMTATGATVEAERLQLPGAAGYPGDVVLEFYAAMLHCTIEVLPVRCGLELVYPVGTGPVGLRLGLDVIADALGHESCHYILLQSWLPQPLRTGTRNVCDNFTGSDLPQLRGASLTMNIGSATAATIGQTPTGGYVEEARRERHGSSAQNAASCVDCCKGARIPSEGQGCMTRSARDILRACPFARAPGGAQERLLLGNDEPALHDCQQTTRGQCRNPADPWLVALVHLWSQSRGWSAITHPAPPETTLRSIRDQCSADASRTFVANPRIGRGSDYLETSLAELPRCPTMTNTVEIWLAISPGPAEQPCLGLIFAYGPDGSLTPLLLTLGNTISDMKDLLRRKMVLRGASGVILAQNLQVLPDDSALRDVGIEFGDVLELGALMGTWRPAQPHSLGGPEYACIAIASPGWQRR